MADVKETLVHWDVGEAISQIARSLGYSRPTAHKYLRAAEQLGLWDNPESRRRRHLFAFLMPLSRSQPALPFLGEPAAPLPEGPQASRRSGSGAPEPSAVGALERTACPRCAPCAGRGRRPGAAHRPNMSTRSLSVSRSCCSRPSPSRRPQSASMPRKIARAARSTSLPRSVSRMILALLSAGSGTRST